MSGQRVAQPSPASNRAAATPRTREAASTSASRSTPSTVPLPTRGRHRRISNRPRRTSKRPRSAPSLEQVSEIDFDQMNRAVIDEFRAKGGRAGGMFANSPLILVHHRGARSGTQRIAPLVYLAAD